MLVCFFHLHARLWVQRHPAFPAPSDLLGERFLQNPDASRRGIADTHLKLCGLFEN